MIKKNKLYSFLAFIFSACIYVVGQVEMTGQSEWINRSNLDKAPFVDAEVVENYGDIKIETPSNTYYYFLNAKYFTNSGSLHLHGDFDYRLFKTQESSNIKADLSPENAEVFYNKSSGVFDRKTDSLTSGIINIGANKIVNRGLITTDNAGIIKISGKLVDLKRGGIEIKTGRDFDHPDGLDENGTPLSWGINNNSVFGSQGAYQDRRVLLGGDNAGGLVTQDWGIRETHWAIETAAVPYFSPVSIFGVGANELTFSTDYSLNFTEITSPYQLFTIWEGAPNWHKANRKEAPYGEYILWNGPLFADKFSGKMDESFVVLGDSDYHHTIQGVLLRQTGSENIQMDVKLNPRTWNLNGDLNPERFYSGLAVEIKTKNGLTNVINGKLDHRSMYVIDELPNVEASQNRLLTNSLVVASKPTLAPESFVLTRYTPLEFTGGESMSQDLRPFRFQFGENNSSTANSSLLGFRITNVVSRAELSEMPVPEIGGVNKMLQAGSIHISADELDLSMARIRAEGGISVKTKNLISSEGAVLDTQNLSLHIGSESQFLVITNMVPEKVERFTGGIKTYSTWWANQYKTRGLGDDPSNETTVNAHYHLLVVDAFMQTELPVRVSDMILRSNTIELYDKMWVADELKIYAENLSINNNLTLGRKEFHGSEEYSTEFGQYSWDYNVAPNLKYFTNNAMLTVPQHANFVNVENNSYVSWVNNGNIAAQDIYVKSKNISNYGLLNSQGSVVLNADSIVLQDGLIETEQSLVINSSNLKFSSQTNIIKGNIIFNISNIVTDGNIESGNYIETHGGIELRTKPKFGDMLGTEIVLQTSDYTTQHIIWNADDKGLNTSGYENNAAIGRLTLVNARNSKFKFSSADTTGSKAIYIDYIDFGVNEEKLMFEDRIETVDIADNITVYFSASNLPAELLDGMYGGRLKWINFPGNFSSMPVYMNKLNKTYFVNKVFRQSLYIDTDNDGTANGFDLTPFGDGVPSVVSTKRLGNKKIEIQWLAFPNSIYRVEYKDEITEDWRLLNEFVYEGISVGNAVFIDSYSKKSESGFYRLKYIE